MAAMIFPALEIKNEFLKFEGLSEDWSRCQPFGFEVEHLFLMCIQVSSWPVLLEAFQKTFFGSSFASLFLQSMFPSLFNLVIVSRKSCQFSFLYLSISGYDSFSSVSPQSVFQCCCFEADSNFCFQHSFADVSVFHLKFSCVTSTKCDRYVVIYSIIDALETDFSQRKCVDRSGALAMILHKWIKFLEGQGSDTQGRDSRQTCVPIYHISKMVSHLHLIQIIAASQIACHTHISNDFSPIYIFVLSNVEGCVFRVILALH